MKDIGTREKYELNIIIVWPDHQSGASGGDPRGAPGEQPLRLPAPVSDGSDRSGGPVSQE